MVRTIWKKNVLDSILELEKDCRDGRVYFKVDGRRTGKWFESIKEGYKWVRTEFEESV